MFKFALTLPANGELLQTCGLQQGGPLQQKIANRVLLASQPYVPKDTGRLIDSGRVEGTDVVWDTPYARRLYYSQPGEFKFKGAPKRGGNWVHFK